MGSEAEEFEGWELLHDSSDSELGTVMSVGSGENVSDDIIAANTVENDSDYVTPHSVEMVSDDVAAQSVGEKESDDIEAHSGGMIQANYFSIDAQHRGAVVTGADMSEEGSESSDNPSWIDPGLEHRYPRKELAEFWSDSGSERSDDRKNDELEGANEVVVTSYEKRELGSQGTKEISIRAEERLDDQKVNELDEKRELGFEGTKEISCGDDRKVDELEGPNEPVATGNEKRELGYEGITEISKQDEESLETFEQLLSNSGGIEVESMQIAEFEENMGMSTANASLEVPLPPEEENGEQKSDGKESKTIEVETRKAEGEKSTIVWWKVPVQFLKYCVFKVSPIWSFPVVAAVLGIVILGRRLYKMKKKTRSLDIKVTMEDKKLSQVVNRAGRLNEAFSVVKRVPVIRPWLPSTGVAQWPAMSLR